MSERVIGWNGNGDLTPSEQQQPQNAYQWPPEQEDTYQIPPVGSSEIPTQATSPEQMPEISHTDRLSERKGIPLFAKVGAAAAFLAVAAGVGAYFGSRGSGNSHEALDPQRPVATAPANPGGSAPQAPEVAPSKLNTLPENYPYQLGGITYESKEDFKKSLTIDVAEYPKGGDAVKRFIDVGLNGWLLSAANIEEHKAHLDFQPDPNVPAGGETLALYYDDAIQEAYFEGQVPDFAAKTFPPYRQYILRDALKSDVEPTNYSADFKFEDITSELQANGPQGVEYTGWTKFKFEVGPNDSSPRKNTEFGYAISMRQVPEKDGTLVWKVTDMQKSDGIGLQPSK